MVDFIMGMFTGLVAMLIFSVVAYETSVQMKVFDNVQEMINECQIELPRNEICVLKAVPEEETK